MLLKNIESGEEHHVHHNVFTVGSGSINNLVVFGDQVRKLHFQILKEPGGFKMLGMNGSVLVNDQAVSEKSLQTDDLLKVGSQRFLVVLESEDKPQRIASEAAQASPSLASDRLLDLIITLLENPDRENSASDVLQSGLELMQADGGYLFGKEGDDLVLLHSIPDDNPSYSNSAVQRAMNSGDSIIWSASESTEDISAQSILQKNIYSILVTPLSRGGEIHGVLYIHRRENRSPFDEGDRKVFSRVSRVLGAVLASHRTLFEQEERLNAYRDVQGEGDFLYSSESMRRMAEMAKRAAQNDVPVLITGETGTGKEVLARFVHANSKRFGEACVAVHCGAIPDSLMEGELFGHEKGAFSGAGELKIGLFELAHGGTLFLDEIGELPVMMQVKILRVLQEGRIRRVGGQEEISIDVRIVASTNRDLQAEVQDAQFREDLFYRLNLIHLNLPPLREREDDILLLAERILKKASARFNMNTCQLSKAAEKALLKYSWPGNVRELENKLQRALLNAPSRVIDVESLELPETAAAPILTLKSVREAAEKRALIHALGKAKGNLTLAASFLGIDRKVLRDIMERLGLQKDEFKQRH